MRQLNHVNIVQLKHCFYCNGEKPDELYLNLVLEYIPDTVYGVARKYHQAKTLMPILHVKVKTRILLFKIQIIIVVCSFTFIKSVEH